MKSKPHNFIALVLASLLVAALAQRAAAQDRPAATEFGVTDQEISALVENYVADDPKAQAAYWKTLMTVPPMDAAKAVSLLSEKWRSRRVNDDNLERMISDAIAPVTDLYGKHYTIFVLREPLPYLEIAGDSVLVVSTGLLGEMQSDDELQGIVAHEAAHSIFVAVSAQLDLQLDSRDKRAAASHSLALVELNCDAVAVRSLLALGRNPLAFTDLNARVERMDKKRIKDDFHPSAQLRAQVAARVVGGKISPAPSKKFLPAIQSIIKLSEAN